MISVRVIWLAALAAASLVSSLHAQPGQQPQPAQAPAAMPAPPPASSRPAAVAAPAQPAAPASDAAGTYTIVIEHYGFVPNRLVVPQGAVVTWVNRDGIRHDATVIGQWTTGTIMPGQSRTVTAAKPGTFAYKCTVHPDMKATLVVEGPN